MEGLCMLNSAKAFANIPIIGLVGGSCLTFLGPGSRQQSGETARPVLARIHVSFVFMRAATLVSSLRRYTTGQSMNTGRGLKRSLSPSVRPPLPNNPALLHTYSLSKPPALLPFSLATVHPQHHHAPPSRFHARARLRPRGSRLRAPRVARVHSHRLEAPARHEPPRPAVRAWWCLRM